LIEALRESLSQVMSSIDNFFNEEVPSNNTVAEKEAINTAEIKPLFKDLHALLEQGNTKAKRIAKEIELLMKDGTNRIKMERIFKLTSHYRYADALRILKEFEE